MRLPKYGSLIFLALLLSAGCGANNNIDTHIVEGAVGGTTVTTIHVSDGDTLTRPIYSWSDINSDTTASRVTVKQGNTTVWDVFDPLLQNSIHSPVVHGPAPPGSAQQVSSPELDLQTNVTYRVTVTKADNNYGYREFLIQP